MRQVGVLLADEVLETFLVFHHGVRAGVAPVTPGVVGDGRGSVAHVVVGRHNEAGVHERHNHVQVAAGVLAEAVHELHDSHRVAGRGVNPAGDGVSVVGGREVDLMEHVVLLSAAGRPRGLTPSATPPKGGPRLDYRKQRPPFATPIPCIRRKMVRERGCLAVRLAKKAKSLRNNLPEDCELAFSNVDHSRNPR